jgi:thiosulfate dehydrogenase
MKNFLLGSVAAIVILPVGALGYFRMGFADAQSDVAPSAFESQMMGAAVHAAVARSAAKLPAPIVDDDMLVIGGKLYVRGCQGCHGEFGKPFAENHGSYPPIPQLPYSGTPYTEPQIYWVVKHGIRMTGMSAYGRFYSEEQLWSIAAFLQRIRSLPPGVAERILAKSANPDSSQKGRLKHD